MNSLVSRKSRLSSPENQKALLEKMNLKRSTFSEKLAQTSHKALNPIDTEIFQINVGKMCNQVCNHCHVDAGPDRKEIMSKETMNECLKALKETPTVHTVDLTGGAPEMNPNFIWFVEQISALGLKTIIRSNLTILVGQKKYWDYPDFFAKHGVTVIASLPCYTEENTDKQRGNGVFNKSIKALQILNEKGYGKEDSDLELHLVYNPGGVSLPPPQRKLEQDYKRKLLDDFGIQFNNLFTITNLPISRFLEYLLASGKYEHYMETLVNAFNPGTIDGLMCRNTLSVSWDGFLYDCDFNQMLDLKVLKKDQQHIRNFNISALKNRTIATGQHCFGCTAGAGSSCQGSLVD